MRPSSCAATALLLTLQLEVRLARDGFDPASAWSGDVSAPGSNERLHFVSLPALIAWLARLEPLPPSSGIR